MSNFETWWEREGQEFLYALNTTTDDDIKLVAEIAWKNGAYCSEQAEQEPVGWYKPSDFVLYRTKPDDVFVYAPLYAAPVRTKDLTDKEIWDLWEANKNETAIEFYEAIIAAYKEKNK